MALDPMAGAATATVALPLEDAAFPAQPAAPAPALSEAARRVRDGLGVPISALPGIEREDAAFVHAHSAGLNRLITAMLSERGHAAAGGGAAGPLSPLWERAELAALEEENLAGLEREWRARTERHPRWAAAARTLRQERDYAAIWRDILGGDFDLRGRGADYTAGMEAFQASRWLGARTLARLLTAGGGGVYLDVLGGDGYVWRLMSAEKHLSDAATADGDVLIVTNDISPHMFYRAGLWGMPTREDATRLSRTFHAGSLDGVLFAYGTHHIPDMFAAAQEAHEVVRPDGTVVVHDFLDEGPAGQWFHRVVDRYSKTGHDIPHIGPVQMAAVLFAAGFRDVALHEIQDPFLFASGEGDPPAGELAFSYLVGMYGMGESFAGRADHFEALVREILTYPEAGEVPCFSDSLVYVPRRAVVATARKAAPGETGYSPADRALIRRIGELFRAPVDEIARRAGAGAEVHPYWFPADGSRWGVSPERMQAWLAWESGISME